MSSERKKFQQDLLASVKQMRTNRPSRVTEADPHNDPNETVDISLRLSKEVFDRWKATGPDWQARMEELLSERLSQ